MLRGKIILRVEIDMSTEEEHEYLDYMERAAALHTKNLLLEHPEADVYQIENVDVEITGSKLY